MFPRQIYTLRKHINWPLAGNTALFFVTGVGIGQYILFTFSSSIWLPRALGMLLFCVSLEKVWTISHKHRRRSTSLDMTELVDSRADVNIACENPLRKEEKDEETKTKKEEKIDLDVAATSEAEAEVEPEATTTNGDDLGYAPFVFQGEVRKYCIVWSTGLVSGVLAGMFGAGGPMLALFATQFQLASLEVRSTFQVPFFLGAIVRLVVIFGIQTSDSSVKSIDLLYIALVGASSSFFGLLIGNHLAKEYLSGELFQFLLVAIVVVGSVLTSIVGLSVESSAIVAAAAFSFFLLFASSVYYRVWKRVGACTSGIFQWLSTRK